MTIAIDYDDTCTTDLKMFSQIIKIMKASGHNPIIVTMRYDHEEDNFLNNIRSTSNNGINVYYTGRKAKQEFMAQLGIYPDIWIDDNPITIFKDL
jgi:ribosomal protein S8